jgi:hypothetical protein
MIRRLVKLNSETGDFLEIDPLLLRREALAVKHYLEQDFDRSSDKYQVYEQVMPLIKGALDGTHPLPYAYSEWPLKHVAIEGLLPRSFTKVFAGFKLAASGAHLDEPQIEIINVSVR